MSKDNFRYFLEIAFKGTAYHGWQVQKNAISVQAILHEKMEILLQESVLVTGAGRTDTGVHARQMFAHFDTNKLQNRMPKEKFLYSLNALLPKDIAVKNIIKVERDAHARFDATERSYEYHIHFSKDPFLQEFSYYLYEKPDLVKMNLSCQFLLGEQDFSCFSKSRTQVFTHICTIDKAEWIKKDESLIFKVTANRFLRNMVRAIVGTCLDIGLSDKSPEHMKDVIASEDRNQAGFSVPPHGLYLTQVKYPYL